MDRTNWKFGKANINILTIGVVYKGVAFPLTWKLLDKQGNSNTEERKEVTKTVLTILKKQHCKGLLADREFVGEEWFSWLIAEDIPFWIRIRNNFQTENDQGKRVPVTKLFRWLRKKPRHYSSLHTICGVQVFLSAAKSEKGFCIIASNRADTSALEHYQQRWSIETLFGFLKTKGFDFEATHMTDPKKISTLFSLLSLAFSWAFFLGEYHESLTPKPLKNHGRKAISTFRIGLDILQKILLNIEFYVVEFNRALGFLPCT